MFSIHSLIYHHLNSILFLFFFKFRMDPDSQILRIKYANVPTNSIYLAFGDDADVPWSFVILVGIRWFISTLGLLSNSALIFVIIKNRFSNLSGICNTLIGLNALFTALFEFSLSIGFIIWLFGTHFLPLKTCFFIQAIPIICRNMIITTLFAIGFDRLLSITFTIWHRRQQYELYLTAILLCCIVHAIFFVFTVIEVGTRWPDLPVPCISSDDTYQGDEEVILFDINTAILCGNVVVYALIWGLLVFQKQSNHAYTQKVIKSLTWHAATLTFCWISYNVLQALFPLIFVNFGPIQNAYFRFVASILPYIAMALNPLMLYFFSKDYRSAYRKQFTFLFPLSPQISTNNPAATTFKTVTRRLATTTTAIRSSSPRIGPTPAFNPATPWAVE